MARDPIDLLHGTLDVLVLKTLSWGPMRPAYARVRVDGCFIEFST